MDAGLQLGARWATIVVVRLWECPGIENWAIV